MLAGRKAKCRGTENEYVRVHREASFSCGGKNHCTCASSEGHRWGARIPLETRSAAERTLHGPCPWGNTVGAQLEPCLEDCCYFAKKRTPTTYEPAQAGETQRWPSQLSSRYGRWDRRTEHSPWKSGCRTHILYFKKCMHACLTPASICLCIFSSFWKENKPL